MAVKKCPKCSSECGPRTKQCKCGHTFDTAVKASDQKMTITDPLDQKIKESINSTKDILNRVTSRGKDDPLPSSVTDFVDERRTLTESEKQPVRYRGRGVISTPSTPCPCNPSGYKKGWPDGPASDEVVLEWAEKVMAAGDGLYTPRAVLYWARDYWDMHAPDWYRIRDLILSFDRTNHES